MFNILRKRNYYEIIKCLLRYCLLSLIIVLFFAFLYYNQSNNTNGFILCFKNSFCVFFNIQFNQNLGLIEILEQLFEKIYMIIYSAIIVKAFLKPQNPIIFSKYACVDSEGLSIRYWIRTKPNDFLYDVKANIDILNSGSIVKGVKNYDKFFTYKEEYNLVRGVRYIKINLFEINLINGLKKITKNESNKSDVLLRIILTGRDNTGMNFTQVYYYDKSNICLGYKFISIRKSEYDSEWYEKNRVEYLRLGNFNKIVSSKASKEFDFSLGNPQKKDVLDLNKLKKYKSEMYLEYYWKLKKSIKKLFCALKKHSNF